MCNLISRAIFIPDSMVRNMHKRKACDLSGVNVYIGLPPPVDFEHKKATIFGGFIIFGKKAHSS